jgi:hypothetical protein
MKKSQLRKIIRESIKELINEQSGPIIISLNPNVRCVKTTNCPQPSGTYTTNATVNGQVPQVGQIIHGGTMHGRRAIIEVNPYQAGSCGSTIVNLPFFLPLPYSFETIHFYIISSRFFSLRM